jgi:hypothetical protein
MATILTKKKDTTGAPATGDLTNSSGGAELAVNTADKRLYTKNSSNAVVEIGTNPGTAVTFVAGTASDPAITTTGDTNTGIFFPAADTIAFAEGGAEAMRIDSSGRVGIGTSSPGRLLTVSNTSGDPFISIVGAASNEGGLLFGDNASDAAGQIRYLHSSDAMHFVTNATERMRIDSSGNVGIGTSTPVSKLDVTVGGSGTRKFVVNYDDSIITAKGSNENSNPESLRFVADNLRFNTGTSGSGTERARITSGGDFEWSDNGAIGSGAMKWVRNSGVGATNSGQFRLAFVAVDWTPATTPNTLYWDGNTGGLTILTSARKYKRNIQDVTDEQLDKALQLKPSYYQRLEYDYWEYGFIADEVEEIGLSELVSKVEGEITGLDYQKLTVFCIGLIQRHDKAIQELKAELDTVKAELATLKGN